ncbi:hypothetical protein Tco_1167663, partial [Tanacetum coccineum]
MLLILESILRNFALERDIIARIQGLTNVEEEAIRDCYKRFIDMIKVYHETARCPEMRSQEEKWEKTHKASQDDAEIDDFTNEEMNKTKVWAEGQCEEQRGESMKIRENKYLNNLSGEMLHHNCINLDRLGPMYNVLEILKLSLQRELLVSKPTTLGDAFALARVTEARLEYQGTVSVATKVASTNGGSHYQRATPVVKTPLLPTPPKANVSPTAKPLAIKWISPAERQERMSKGLCFNCYNRWTRGHKCPGKFLLLMTNSVEDTGEDLTAKEDEAVESGDISILNSLVGYGSPRSLQLWGKIGTTAVHILIDNG